MFLCLIYFTTWSGWTSRVGSGQVTTTDLLYQRTQGFLEGFSGVFMRFDGIHLVYSIICIVCLLFRCIPTNFKKTELLMGLTQLIMLKVAFQEQYLTKYLSVIDRWNQNEKIYRMRWLEVSFSGLRRHGGQFTIFPH